MKTLRPYQDKAAAEFTRHRRGIVVVPAGGGKTIIAASAIERALRARAALGMPRARIRWIAATTDQCEQGRRALEEFGILDAAEVEIGCPGKVWKLWNPDLVVIDECHHVAADSWQEAIDDCEKARWGLTATPFRNDEMTEDIFRLIGPVIFQVSQDDLRAIGAIVPGVVRYQLIPDGGLSVRIDAMAAEILAVERRRLYMVDPEELKKRIKYRVAKEHGIEKNPVRNGKIAEIANDSDEPTLLLVGSIEHGERLIHQIGSGTLLHSKTKGRKRIVESFRNQEIPLLVATSLADEGFDAPCASRLILAAGGRAANRVEQRAGRVLRPSPGKTHGTIFDFQDNQHPFLRAQSNARRSVYRKLGYQIYDHAN